MKKSVFLFVTLFLFSVMSSGCWSSKRSGGVVLNFELNGQIVDVKIDPVPEPEIVNEKRYGGFYTELSSYNLGAEEHLSFGYFREEKSEEPLSGIWHIKDDQIKRLFTGGRGEFYGKGKSGFAYVNSEYWHEKQSVIFEVRKDESGKVYLQEIFFLLGKVWKIAPKTENKIWVIGHSNASGEPAIAEIEISANKVTVTYGDFIKSSPSLNEIYGIE